MTDIAHIIAIASLGIWIFMGALVIAKAVKHIRIHLPEIEEEEKPQKPLNFKTHVRNKEFGT